MSNKTGGTHNVLAYGALGDGTHLETAPLQAAIDACSHMGGMVVFPPGRYLTGTLFLKSGVHLHLQAGATLLGSPNLSDYAANVHYNRYDNETCLDRCLLYCQDGADITLEGPGQVDGNGKAFFDPHNPYAPHPMLIRLLRCSNVRLQNLSIRMPAGWSTAFIECSGVFAQNVDIVSRHSNGDGLDFDSCHDVLVSNCRFDTSDDAICLQSSVPGRSCRNVVISNCVVTSKWAAVRIGLMSAGDIENVVVDNCVFHDIQCSGLKIQATEGGCLRNMRFSNIVMQNVVRPIFLTANYYPITKGVSLVQDSRAVGGLSFHGITATYDDAFPPDPAAGIVLMGTPERRLHDISLTDIVLLAPGGYQEAPPGEIPELSNKRPEYYVFEQLPAWGIYARHLSSPYLQNIRLRCRHTDTRKPLYLEDVVSPRLEAIHV